MQLFDDLEDFGDRILDRMRDITICEPTYVMRGQSELHITFTPQR